VGEFKKVDRLLESATFMRIFKKIKIFYKHFDENWLQFDKINKFNKPVFVNIDPPKTLYSNSLKQQKKDSNSDKRQE